MSHTRSLSFFKSKPSTDPHQPGQMQRQIQRLQLVPQTVPQLPPPSLHPEIQELNRAHAHKVYHSGPLICRFERLPDGSSPKKDEGWTDIWAQLGGTTLSTWNLKDCQEASEQGREIPPSYIDITDAVCYSFLFFAASTF